MERPLTETEQQVFARHAQQRDRYMALAEEQQGILNELAVMLGGDGCQIDLGRGVAMVPDPEDECDGCRESPELVEDDNSSNR